MVSFLSEELIWHGRLTSDLMAFETSEHDAQPRKHVLV